MIPQIKEINFGAGTSADYATLHQATVSLQEMGDRTITTQVRIDGDVVPDFTGWELEFKGERFILPIKEPQATKDNTTRNSLIDLTFYSWATYQMKRYFYMSLSEIQTGVAIADQYKASVVLPVEQFVEQFNQVLNHYFGSKIRMDLYHAGSGIYSNDPVNIELDYTYIWDVLTRFYEIFELRWKIEYEASTESYVIKVNFPADEIEDHDFEYGYKGGLLKFERQVQDDDITNILLGRGGEKNLPYRYFKREDPQNPEWAADPDAIYELRNVYFDALRDANFRWYVRGWMKNPNRDKTWENDGYVYPTYEEPEDDFKYAYQRGLTDEKFNPVEFVRDAESITKYGERWGALENNEDIYPTIQGVSVSGLGRIDEVVAVSEIVTDDIEDAAKKAATTESLGGELLVTYFIPAGSYYEYDFRSNPFTVPAGKTANLSRVFTAMVGNNTDALIMVDTESSTMVVVDENGREFPAVAVPAGTYYAKLHIIARNNNLSGGANVTFGVSSLTITYADSDDNAWKPTFDIWVKNIWGTEQGSGESDLEYASRVWSKILGDRVGNEAKIVFSDGFMAASSDYDFVIASYPVVDRTKHLPSGIPSEWKITLYKSSAEFDATGLFVPNSKTGGKPVAGDHFFFTGIDMPFMYVELAEEDITSSKKDSLKDTSKINPTWIITLDKVRIHTTEDEDYGVKLVDRLAPGTKLRIKDTRFTAGDILTLYVQSMTYTWNEPTESNPYLVPDVELVLSDKIMAVESTVKSLQNSVEYIRNTYSKSSDIAEVVRRVASPMFLRKTGESDTSESPTAFGSSVNSKDYRQGSFGGAGWGFYKDLDGNSVLEVDKLYARKELNVNTIVSNQIVHVGGKQVLSAAAIECTQVVEDDSSYTCMFDQKQGTVSNLFKVGDIAFGQTFSSENVETRYYRAAVIETGPNYIRISKSNKSGSGAPVAGDTIAQFGHLTDTSRQYVIIRDVIGGGYERMLSGLNSVTANGDEYYFAGRMSGSTPRWFVGDKNRQYLEYQDGLLNIAGTLRIVGGSGLKNMEEWNEMSNDVDNALQKAIEAGQNAHAAQEAVVDAERKIQELQTVIDTINDDSTLDLTEKRIIRTQWVNINGSESLTQKNDSGSYYQTRKLYERYGAVADEVKYIFASRSFTYNGKIYTYQNLGISSLDAAYTILRDFLSSVELNDKTKPFEGFDRERFSVLLTAYYDAEILVNESVNRAQEQELARTKNELLANIASFQSAVESSIQDIRDIVDNTIESWFYPGVPTLNNLPASQWSESEYESHVGDLYYDDDTGIAYRFQYNESTDTYYWKELSDTGAAKALALARQAKDTADSKRRTFLAQPTDSDAYDEGDLWLHATIGSYVDETLVCVSAKVAGAVFRQTDWATATKYTDDTVANIARTEAARVKEIADAATLSARDAAAAAARADAAAQAAQQRADDAASAADSAQQTADSAATAAQEANSKLGTWASDSYISPQEKTGLFQQWKDVQQEKEQIMDDAIRYNVDSTDYSSAYSLANNAFQKYTASTPESILIESDYGDIEAYYTARTEILQAIATASKKIATDAQTAANNARTAADNAQSAADQAQSTANSAVSSASAARAAAQAAQATADEAKASAISANSQLDNWKSDSMISPAEKEALRQQWKDVQTEYAQVIREANTYGVATADFTAAYNNARTAFQKYTAATPDFIPVDSADYSYIADYYDARATITQAIAAAAKSIADNATALANAAQASANAAAASAARAQESANSAMSAAQAAQQTADNAATAAAAAQSTADSAASAAAEANNKLSDWSSDSKISPAEKTGLRQQWKDVQTEYGQILSDAERYGVDSTAYENAYSSADDAFEKYTAETPESITIESDYANIAGYYDARQSILSAVAAAAKKIADDAQTAADNARTKADSAQSAADQAKQDADAAMSAANAAQASALAADAEAKAAQATATAAEVVLQKWGEDDLVSPAEKEPLRQQYKDVVTEYENIIHQAELYEIDSESFSEVYQDAVAAFKKYTAASPDFIQVEDDYKNIAAYYDARAIISQNIADSARKRAVDAIRAELKNTWIGINGIVSTEAVGEDGTYAAAREMINAAASATDFLSYVYGDKKFTYNNVVYTFKGVGSSELDAAYMSLRKYLNDIGLNEDNDLAMYDQATYADLLRDYDVRLNAILNVLSDIAKKAADAAQADATRALREAADARQKADQAASDLSETNSRLNTWASDTYISPQEKTALTQEWKDVQTERNDIVLQAQKYNVDSTAYVAAFNRANTAFGKYTAATPENILIENDYANISAYYDARVTILNQIATAAATKLGEAYATANNAMTKATEATEQLDSWGSDGEVSPMEKRSLLQVMENMRNEYTSLVFQCTQYNLPHEDLDSAYSAAMAALQKYTANLLTTSPRGEDYDDIAPYYPKRDDALEAVSAAAKALADAANAKANALQEVIGKFQDDGYISPQEKRALLNAYNNERDIKDTICATAANYGLDTTEVESYYDTYGDVIDYYCIYVKQLYDGRNNPYGWDDSIPIDNTHYPLSAIQDYYDAKAALQDEIDTAVSNSLDAKAEKSDVQYLTTALAKDETVITGGLVLSSFIGVKDSNGVQAAINASTAVDGFNYKAAFSAVGDHGRLMIAAGINGVTTAYSNAATRIFEDGTVITNQLNADGGTIGGFVIGTDSLGIMSVVGGSVGYTGLVPGGIIKAESDYFRVPTSIAKDTKTFYVDASYQSDCILKISAHSVLDIYAPTLIELDAEEGKEAIKITRGYIAGFRPRTIVVTSDYSITKYDYNVIVNNSSQADITLPEEPEEGQSYVINHNTMTNFNIRPSGYDRIFYGDAVELLHSSQFRGLFFLTYCKNLNIGSQTRNGWICSVHLID